MAVATRAIVQGNVLSVSTRKGSKVQDDGKSKPWEMVEVLIVGESCLAMATLDKGLEPPAVGEVVTAQIEVGVFRGQDSVRVISWLA